MLLLHVCMFETIKIRQHARRTDALRQKKARGRTRERLRPQPPFVKFLLRERHGKRESFYFSCIGPCSLSSSAERNGQCIIIIGFRIQRILVLVSSRRIPFTFTNNYNATVFRVLRLHCITSHGSFFCSKP